MSDQDPSCPSGYSREDFYKLAGNIAKEAEYIHAQDGSVIKMSRYCWNVRHDPDQDYSIENMTDDEICEAIVEDLLIVTDWERRGKVLSFNADDLKRFLPQRMHARVDRALEDPFVASLLVSLSDGQIRIHPNHRQDACDFAGVWFEGDVPVTDGDVYVTNVDRVRELLENDEDPEGVPRPL
jgi:hypothetical protein